MGDFKIISDSSCDLPKSILDEHSIDIVPYYVTFDNHTYFREGVDIQVEEFYGRILEKGVYPKTSLPPIQDYIDVFRRNLEAGLDIVCVCLTAKFSGSVQSAYNAKNMLLEEYPGRRIEIMDSVNVTGTQGMLLLEMVKMKNNGLAMDEILQITEKIKEDRLIVFTPDTLEYLQRGGRIGKATALAGNIFNIKPVILFDKGELIPHSKVRGRKKVLGEILDVFDKSIPGDRSNYNYAILNSACTDEAADLKKAAAERGIQTTLPMLNIGVTICVHTGPRTIGLAYFRKFDTIS